MELCEIDLHKLLNMYNSDSRNEYVYDIFKQILLGIRYLHSNSIIHRDLKPANILIKLMGDDIKVKLSDFGCSKIINEYTTHTINNKNTEINNILLPRIPSSEYIGTILYVAPEIETLQHHDCSSDIYSLGLILFEMITDFISVSEKTDKFTNIRNNLNIYDNPIHNIINKMISINPNDRPNINELIRLWSSKQIKNIFKR